jgi:hypothetical protein
MSSRSFMKSCSLAGVFVVSFLLGACGNSVTGSSLGQNQLPKKTENVEQRETQVDAQVLALGEQLRADLLQQGLSEADAHAIVLGAVAGADQGEEPALALVDVKSFLPGFLKGALGVAKTVFAGTPLGVAGSIVESIVKNAGQKKDTPREVLQALPGVALETLLKLATKEGPFVGQDSEKIDETIRAMLAAVQGVGQVSAPSDAKAMMEKLMAVLVRQPGMNVGNLEKILPAAQQKIQDLLLKKQNLPLKEIFAALTEGQFGSLLNRVGKTPELENLLALLLQKNASGVLASADLKEDSVRKEILEALSTAAAKPLEKILAPTGNWKKDFLKKMAEVLTKSVGDWKGQPDAIKKEALEASLVGLSKGLLASKTLSAQELSEVFAKISQALKEAGELSDAQGSGVTAKEMEDLLASVK